MFTRLNLPARNSFVTSEPSKTRQSFKDECDINNILARYVKTGICDHVARRGPEYNDIDPIDFETAMQIIADATTMFNELPSPTRLAFNNDPREFLTYVQDPANASELHKYGFEGPVGPARPVTTPAPASGAENGANAPENASADE